MAALFVSCFLLSYLTCIHAHGRLVNPAGRSSAWRYGFKTPINYNDNELFCGGFGVQWGRNDGKCGVCGDNWAQTEPRDHEAGGKYASGFIVQEYKQGQTINVTVEVTANHLGFFEFRLCPVNNVKVRATHECLNRNLLKRLDGSTRKYIGTTLGMVSVILQLPVYLTCSQCVLQWRYHTENSWGTDEETGRQCLGCGRVQEEFYGCADVAIKRGYVKPTPQPTTKKPLTKRPTTMKPTTAKPTTPKPATPKPTTPKPATLKPTTLKPTTLKPATQKPGENPSICAFICRFNNGRSCPDYCKNAVNGWKLS